MKINIQRPPVSEEDFKKAVYDLMVIAPEIREKSGDGAFVCPHEIVGMAVGQLNKLSVAADASLYSDDGEESRIRCLKFAYGLIFAAASMDVVSR